MAHPGELEAAEKVAVQVQRRMLEKGLPRSVVDSVQVRSESLPSAPCGQTWRDMCPWHLTSTLSLAFWNALRACSENTCHADAHGVG